MESQTDDQLQTETVSLYDSMIDREIELIQEKIDAGENPIDVDEEGKIVVWRAEDNDDVERHMTDKYRQKKSFSASKNKLGPKSVKNYYNKM